VQSGPASTLVKSSTRSPASGLNMDRILLGGRQPVVVYLVLPFDNMIIGP
jgi:hypothetical protein